MAWTTALAELRALLCDTTSDNLVKQKAVLGPQDGTNSIFYTFDDRLVTSGVQSLSPTPLHVYQYTAATNVWAELGASGINVTDPLRGTFQITMGTLPAATDQLTTSYHYQQSFDSELNGFLQQAANQTNVTDITQVPPGLQLAALQIAASLAHQRLAVRWEQRKSDQFMLQDAPARAQVDERVKFHQAEAEKLQANGLALRKSFYDLSLDQGRTPAFAILNRPPRPWTPQR